MQHLILAIALIQNVGPQFEIRGELYPTPDRGTVSVQSGHRSSDFAELIRLVPYYNLHVSFKCILKNNRLTKCDTEKPNVEVPSSLRLERFINGVTVVGNSALSRDDNGSTVVGAFALNLPGRPIPPKLQCNPLFCTSH